ncbi:hypothetical protein HDV00_012613, partial [Rhizophlyctis rosea]
NTLIEEEKRWACMSQGGAKSTSEWIREVTELKMRLNKYNAEGILKLKMGTNGVIMQALSGMLFTTPGITFDQLSGAIMNTAAAMNLDKKPRGTKTTTTSHTSLKGKVTETKTKTTPGVSGGEEKDHLIATRGCFFCRKENAGHVVSNCPEREGAEEGSSAAAVTNGNEALYSDEDNANYNSDDNVVGDFLERIQRSFNSDSNDSNDDFVSAISRAFLEEPFVVAVSKARPTELDFILTALLEKHPLNTLIDTGSASSFVSREFIKKFRVRYNKLDKPRSYTQASKGAFETTAYVKGRIDTTTANLALSNSRLPTSTATSTRLSDATSSSSTRPSSSSTPAKPATKKGNAGDGKITSVGRTLPLSSLNLKKKVVASVNELKEALEYEGELWDLDEFVGAIEEEEEQETNGFPEAIVVLEVPDLRVTGCSDQWLQLVDRKRGDVFGRRMKEAFPPSKESMVAMWEETLARTAETGKEQSLEDVCYDIRNVHVNITALRQESSGIQEVLKSGHMMALIIQNIRNYAVIMLDPNGVICTWNNGAERIKGYTAEEVIGRHFSLFYTAEDVRQGIPGKALEAAQTNGRFEMEAYRRRKNGTLFWADVIITRILDNDGTHGGFPKITRDLTDRKGSEDAILKAFEDSTRVRAQFTASMSHEIQTPMNGVVSAARLLPTAGMTKEGRSLVRIILESSETLLSIVSDILDHTKLDVPAFSLVKKPFNLRSKIMYTINLARINARDKTAADLLISIAESVPEFVQGDNVRFRQVLSNLLDNAVKFTRTGSIKVVADGANRATEAARVYDLQVSVTDTGVGITEEDQGQLFKPFSQGDQRQYLYLYNTL